MNNSSEATSSKPRYGLIDIMRLVMAVSVVFLHRWQDTQYQTVFKFFEYSLFEYAVPFFMMVSSFFLFRKTINETNNTVADSYFRKYIKKLAQLYLIWSLIYLPVSFIKFYYENGLSIKMFIMYYMRSIFIDGSSFWHLWYMQALILSLILIYFLFKKINLNLLIIIFFIGYILYHFVSYRDLFDESSAVYIIGYSVYKYIPESVLRFMLRSPIFILLGIKSISSFNKSKKIYYTAFVITTVINIAVTVLRIIIPQFVLLQSIVLPINAYFMFNTVLRIKLDPNPLYIKFRNISALVYFVHWIIPQEIIYTVCYLLHAEQLGYSAEFKLLFTLLYSFLTAIIIEKLSQNEKFRFLKKLY